MIQAIVFDCYGVLYADAYMQFVDQYATSRDMRHRLQDLATASDRHLVSDAEFYAQLSVVSGRPADEIRAQLRDTGPFDQAVADIIKRLKPHYRIGMLSNAQQSFLDRFLSANHARALFDEVLASSESRYMKPQREIFEEIAERLGVELPDMLFIDDSSGHTSVASGYGIPSITFESATKLERDLKAQGIMAP